MNMSSITNGLAAEMKRRFPWLGTEENAGSGADVISQLAGWYNELMTGEENQRRERELLPTTILKAHGYKARRVKGGKYNLIRIEDGAVVMANLPAAEVRTFAKNLQERNELLRQDKERAGKRAGKGGTT